MSIIRIDKTIIAILYQYYSKVTVLIIFRMGKQSLNSSAGNQLKKQLTNSFPSLRNDRLKFRGQRFQRKHQPIIKPKIVEPVFPKSFKMKTPRLKVKVEDNLPPSSTEKKSSQELPQPPIYTSEFQVKIEEPNSPHHQQVPSPAKPLTDEMIELQVYENGVSSFCPINEQSCEFWKKNKPVTLWISLSNRKQQIPCKRKLIKKGKTTPILKKEVICKEEQRDAQIQSKTPDRSAILEDGIKRENDEVDRIVSLKKHKIRIYMQKIKDCCTNLEKEFHVLEEEDD